MMKGATGMKKIAIMGLAALAATGAAAKPPEPFPVGYDAAYRTFLSSLTPAERQMSWLGKLMGVYSPKASISIGGKPHFWISTCKPHDCAENQAVIFLPADRKQAKTVLRINGALRLRGGASAAEAACVNRLFNSGWTITRC
jgi:hypothetical protein